MDDAPTCGKGLAAHSVLQARLGELLAAVADTLEVHMGALDLSDENARKEREAYYELARAHRDVSRKLATIAARMAAYRSLPMARHDPKAMASAAPREAFARYVAREQELAALLDQKLQQDRSMLTEMSSANA